MQLSVPPPWAESLATNKMLRAELGLSLLQTQRLWRQLDAERQELKSQVVASRKARSTTARLITD